MNKENTEFGDAYQGARGDLAIWKRRALEAEGKVREQDQIIDRLGAALNEENGPSFMGEPAMTANQTIDGVLVSRELAKRLAVPMLRTSEYLLDHRDALDELRALLDADKVNNRQMGLMQFVEAHPIKPTGLSQGWNLTRKHDGFVVGHQSVAYPPDGKAIERAERDGYVWVPFLLPAAQPQGEPVNQVRSHGSCCWEDIIGESLELVREQPEEYEVRTLYRHPQASRGEPVVLMELVENNA